MVIRLEKGKEVHAYAKCMVLFSNCDQNRVYKTDTDE